MAGDGFEIAGIDHVQVAMPAGAEDVARAYYGGLLGIAERKKPDVLARHGGCWFENSAVKIHLGVEADFRPAQKAHPGIRVQGIKALARRLEAAGFALQDNERLETCERFFTRDPFGNRLEFLEPITP